MATKHSLLCDVIRGFSSTVECSVVYKDQQYVFSVHMDDRYKDHLVNDYPHVRDLVFELVDSLSLRFWSEFDCKVVLPTPRKISHSIRHTIFGVQLLLEVSTYYGDNYTITLY